MFFKVLKSLSLLSTPFNKVTNLFRQQKQNYVPLAGHDVLKSGSNSTYDVFQWFEGTFDNKEQYCEDLQQNVTEKHEYVTAKFSTYAEKKDVLIAKYYYGNNDSNVFRFRFYEFTNSNIIMKLLSRSVPIQKIIKIYRPLPQTLTRLESSKFNLETYLPRFDECEHLAGCDVIFKYNKLMDAFRGTLVEDTCEICSQREPTIKLKVVDELFLWRNDLWINDRVYNQKGVQVIGNKNGIPYKLKRTQ